MENLNKENFWNELHKQYPLSVNDFCNWIDDYKKKNNWDRLFNAGLMVPIRGTSVSPKFHDLPFDMQRGILTRYFEEKIPRSNGYEKHKKECIEGCREFFQALNELYSAKAVRPFSEREPNDK